MPRVEYNNGVTATTDEGNINKFLEVEITQLDDKISKISQPFLVDKIISFLNIDTNYYGMNTNTKSTPIDKPLLSKDLLSKPHK